MNDINATNGKRNMSDLFASSFPLLYGSRDRIWSDPYLYGADIGVNTYGNNGKVGLGAVLHAIDSRPDLFQLGETRIISFYGNPLTGTTVNRTVDLRTGVASSVGGSGFIAKIRALNAASALYPMSENAASLGEVVRMLGKEVDSAGEGSGETVDASAEQ